MLARDIGTDAKLAVETERVETVLAGVGIQSQLHAR